MLIEHNAYIGQGDMFKLQGSTTLSGCIVIGVL